MRRGATAAVVTILFAAAAAGGVFLFMQNVREKAREPEPTVTVLVSRADIPAGTQLDPLVEQGNFVTEPVLASSVIRNVITDVYQLRGQRTAYPILAGEQISAARLAGALQAKGGELGIPVGYQAASLTLEEQRIVAGAPREGDHVEVWGTFSTTAQRTSTRVVIQDAEVLAAPTSSNNNTITLAVSPVEASRLIYAQEQGHVWLTLLPPNQKGVPVPPVTSVSVR